MARQEADQLAALFLRRPIEIGRAMKMDEDEAAATLHHAVRGDGRIEAAGDERYDASAGADRQAFDAGDLFETEESRVRQDLDVDRELGVLEIDADAGLLFHRRAERPVDLRRGERKCFVRAARIDAERREVPPVDAIENALAQ